jgi:hypothetical protein
MTLVQQTPLLKLVVDYLPSIFISVVNFVLPFVFNFIAPLEGLTRSRQVVFILLRFQSCGMGWMGWGCWENGEGNHLRVMGSSDKIRKSCRYAILGFVDSNPGCH